MAESASPSSDPSRPARLPRGSAFERVFQEGRSAANALLVVRSAPNSEGVTRCGFAVGKRLAPLAVDRNRVRRRLREALRTLPLPPDTDLVVTARAPALKATFDDLRSALAGLLKRLAK
jgi:ribonuclease P protein component